MTPEEARMMLTVIDRLTTLGEAMAAGLAAQQRLLEGAANVLAACRTAVEPYTKADT